MRAALACWTALLAAAATAVAGPPRLQWVDAEASWMVHLDVEAITDSSLGRYILEHGEEIDIDLDDLDEIEEEIGIDPRRDILSATIYGGRGEDESPTVILLMTPRADEVLEKMRDQEHYRRLKVDDYTLHRWEEDDRMYFHLRPDRRGERRIAVLSEDKSRVLDACRVLDGDRDSLADARAADEDEAEAIGRPRRGSLVFAFAKGLPWLHDDDDPASAILQRSDRVLLEVRERGSTTMADLLISARSADDARNISDVVQGLLALGRIMAAEEPDLDELGDILHDIKVESEHNDIRISLRIDSEKLTEHLPEIHEHVH
jgi:hypothetical protein